MEQAAEAQGADSQVVEAQTETREVSNDNQKQEKQNADYQGFVDLNGLPDDQKNAIEGRFAHLSRLIKKTETKAERELREWRQVAADQAARIEELTGGVGAVVNHLQNQTFAQTETQLKAQLRQARDTGDLDLENEIQDKLSELRFQKQSAKEFKIKPKEKNETNRMANAGTPSAMQIANEAAMDGDITDEDMQVIGAWTEEKSSNGQLLRPWSVNKGTETNPDPQYIAGLATAQAVWINPRFKNATVEQKLAEVDRLMGTEKHTNGQAVMGGGFTPRTKSNTLRLTPQQERIATKTKFGANRGAKSDAEYIEAYRKQLESTRKGAR